MDADVLPPKLLTVLHTAAEKVRGHDFIHVFSHYDADGVAAASVLAVMLERLGKEYQVSTLPVLNDTTFEAVESSSADCILMSDMGASYIPQLEGLGRDVVVLDHHRTDYDSDRIVYANPHLYGIDGMTSACGSTMALLLAEKSTWSWRPSLMACMILVGTKFRIVSVSELDSTASPETATDVPRSTPTPGFMSIERITPRTAAMIVKEMIHLNVWNPILPTSWPSPLPTAPATAVMTRMTTDI